MIKKKHKNDFEDIISHFYEFDFEEIENKEVKKKIDKLTRENQDLKKLVKTLKKQVVGESKIKNLTRRYSYEEISERISSEFTALSPESTRSLATAEYLYLNEKEPLDYSGIFMTFVKVFEGELKRVLKSSDKKATLGLFMKRLKEIKELRTFVSSLEKINIIEVRNKAVHMLPISKGECGKLREILLEERWLHRMCHILNEISSETTKIEFEAMIEKYEGKEKIGNKLYNCYTTNLGEYVLSERYLHEGKIKIQGITMEHIGITYIMI
jgi:hypothetical protein